MPSHLGFTAALMHKRSVLLQKPVFSAIPLTPPSLPTLQRPEHILASLGNATLGHSASFSLMSSVWIYGPAQHGSTGPTHHVAKRLHLAFHLHPPFGVSI